METDIAQITLLVTQLTATLAAVVGLLFLAKQVRLATESVERQHDWNRRHAAQQAILSFNSTVTGIEELQKELDFLNKKEPIPSKTILDLFEANHEMQLVCHRLLNFYEGLARGIHQGLYDEEVIRVARMQTMIRTFDSFKAYMDERRAIHPQAFSELETLVNHWRSQLSDLPRRHHTG